MFSIESSGLIALLIIVQIAIIAAVTAVILVMEFVVAAYNIVKMIVGS